MGQYQVKFLLSTTSCPLDELFEKDPLPILDLLIILANVFNCSRLILIVLLPVYCFQFPLHYRRLFAIGAEVSVVPRW